MWARLVWFLTGCAAPSMAAHMSESEDRWTYKPPLATSTRRYEGIEMNFLFPDFIAHGLSGQGEFFVDRIKQFCDETGASATMTHKAFPTAYRKELEYDLDSGLNFYDAFNFFGSWMPGLVEQGDHLLKLTEYVKSAADIAWSDILPAVRRGVCEYKNEIYMLPADGDVIVMIYRKDLLDLHGLKKPDTWEEWLEVSKYFREKVGPQAWVDSPNRTLAQEGGSGACMMTKRNDWAYANLFAYLSTFLQAHGPRQGVFFDPVTMEPLFKTPAVREALVLYKDLVEASTHTDRPCEECTDDGGAGLFTMVEDMQMGRCMMGFNYMGPVKFIASGAFNTKNNSIALSPAPGSTRVKAAEGDTLVSCADKESNCPFGTMVPTPNGTRQKINRATYYSGGGQSWAISNHIKDQKKKDALWEFFKGLIDKTNGILSTTAADYLLDPFRQSTLDGLQVQGSLATVKFMENNWKWDQLGTMKDTLNTVFNDQNSVLDLKIVEGGSYIEETDAIMLQYLQGAISVDQVIEQMSENWEARTRTLGLTNQRNLYRGVLGLPPVQLDCPAGTESILGKCEDCPIGKYRAEGDDNEKCRNCEAGTYQNLSKQSSCISCGDVIPGSTSYRASESATDCVCADGTYLRPGVECKPCSEGLVCPRGMDAPTQAKGFFAEILDERTLDIEVFECVNVDWCQEGPPGRCADTRQGRACARMDSDECPWFVWPILPFAFVCVFYIMYRISLTTTYGKVSPLSMLAGNIAVAFVAMQTSQVYLQFFEKLPTELDALFSFTKIFMLNFNMILPACNVGQSFEARYGLAIFPPLVIVGSFAILFFVTRVLSKVMTCVQPMNVNQTINTAGTVLQVMYVMQCKDAFSFFKRKANPSGRDTVQDFSDVIFGSDTHFGVGPVCIFAYLLLFYVIGLYCLFVFVIRRAPANFEDVGFRTRWRFLMGRWRPSCAYWSLPMLARNLLIALSPIFFDHMVYQSMFFSGLLLIHALAEARFMPWLANMNTIFELVTSVILVFMSFAGLAFTDGASKGEKTVAASMIYIFLIGVWGVCFGACFLAFWRSRPKALKDQKNRREAVGHRLMEAVQTLSELTEQASWEQKWSRFLVSCPEYDLSIMGSVAKRLNQFQTNDIKARRWSTNSSGSFILPGANPTTDKEEVQKTEEDGQVEEKTQVTL